MTDTPVQDTAASTAQAGDEKAKAQPPDLWDDGSPFDAKKARELLDQLREQNKTLKGDAKKLKDLEGELNKRKEAEMSELEKTAKKLQEAEQKAAALERKELQRTAAEKAGLPAAFASRVQGDTLEAMEADAKELLDAMPKEQKADNKKTPPTIPSTNPPVTSAGETPEARAQRLGIRMPKKN